MRQTKVESDGGFNNEGNVTFFQGTIPKVDGHVVFLWLVPNHYLGFAMFSVVRAALRFLNFKKFLGYGFVFGTFR